MNKYFSSDLNILANLLSSKPLKLVVYDPFEKLIQNDSTELIKAANLQEACKILDYTVVHEWCLVNISNKNIESVNADFVIDFGSNNSYSKALKLRWQFITNPDGTIRWLYPRKISKPWFLEFYNSNGFKAKVFKTIIRLGFSFRFNTILSNGYVNICSNQPTYAEILLRASSRPNYSIFTGTVGINRKIILADAAKGRVTAFIKIPLSDCSWDNIHNEAISVRVIKSFNLPNLLLPKMLFINKEAVLLKNIKRRDSIIVNTITITHLLFLENLYKSNNKNLPIKELQLINQTKRKLKQIGLNIENTNLNQAKTLYNFLVQLLDLVTKESEELLSTSMMHGDFTPWNMYISGENLSLYDWELAKPNSPMLFDVFHFVIQSEVLINKSNGFQVRTELNRVMSLKEFKNIVNEFNINVNLHFKLYLLYTVSYYLDIYINQINIHTQAEWLINTWIDLIEEQIIEKQGFSMREGFIKDMFKYLENKSYAVLKSIGKDFWKLPESSDIDLIINKDQALEFIHTLIKHSSILKYVHSQEPHMNCLSIYFKDGTYLSIDLLHNFYRKEIQYIDPKLLLKNSTIIDGIKYLKKEYDYLYIWLFHQLNNSPIPEKYSLVISKNTSDSQKERIVTTLNTNVGTNYITIEETFERSLLFEIRKNLIQKLSKENSYLKRSLRGINYFIHVLLKLISNNGMIITFTGVDGAGKTTILTNIKSILEEKYRKKVVIIRHRPSIFPILSAWKYGKAEAEKRSVNSLPRTGKNSSKLSSIIRFTYYYFDYIFGQLIVYLKYLSKGYIVLYDRYYFDFIVDGKRSNLLLNESFVKSLYLFVQKPQISIFLYAQPEIIIQRKEELSLSDIKTLTDSYLRLFNGFNKPNTYFCIENNSIPNTLSIIEKVFIQKAK